MLKSRGARLDDETIVRLLKEAELRVTQPRIAVLSELDRDPHADVETIAGAVRTRLGSVSTQAVYDILNAFTTAGLVRRIEPAGSPARFEVHVGDNHHHMVCRTCGTILDVACEVGDAPCLHLHDTHGFVVDEAEIIFWGTCPTCSTQPRNTATTTDDGGTS